VTIVDAEPLGVFLQVDRDLIFVGLPV
jgi:hypothetical protein